MDEEQFGQLMWQAIRGETDVVLAAVDAEPGLVTRAGGHGWTLLHYACSRGHVDLARGLLDRKADIHQRSDGGGDALICASANGHVPVLVLLISRGADVNARDNDGWTALASAAGHDNLPVCLYLISQQADLLSVNNHGRSVLERYGRWANLTSDVKKQRRALLQHAYDEGPHPNARWARRWPFVMVLVCYDFQPTAARRAVLLALHPPLPPNVPIPAIPIGTKEQYRAYLLGLVFSHPGFWKIIASYI
jgi:Ankyrin repeats (3 copies)